MKKRRKNLLKKRRWPKAADGGYKEIPLSFDIDWCNAPRYCKGLPNFGYSVEPALAVEANGPRRLFVGNIHVGGGFDTIWQEFVLGYSELRIWPMIITDDFDPTVTCQLDSVGISSSTLEAFMELARLQDRTFPGLAAGCGATSEFSYIPPDIGSGEKLLTVATYSPADVPTYIGWIGARHRGLSPAIISAVLASWQERFGAVLIAMGNNCLKLQVPKLQLSTEQENLLALEHQLLCPDLKLDSPEAKANYSRTVLKSRNWIFRW